MKGYADFPAKEIKTFIHFNRIKLINIKLKLGV